MSTPELHGYPRTTGNPNGRPAFKPYVRNPAIAARETEIAERLEQLRARIQADIDGECTICGGQNGNHAPWCGHAS